MFSYIYTMPLPNSRSPTGVQCITFLQHDGSADRVTHSLHQSYLISGLLIANSHDVSNLLGRTKYITYQDDVFIDHTEVLD